MSITPLAMCVDGECRPTTVSLAAPSNLEITAPVGRNTPNRPNDVKTIQDALNQVPPTQGGPLPPLKTDGLCWGKTQAAIGKFQKEACGFQWPDVRIDPNGKTHNRLRQFFVPVNPYTVQLIYALLPKAVQWINAAQRVLGQAELHLNSGMFATPEAFNRVSRYFHLDQQSRTDALVSIRTIRSVFTNMHASIGHHFALTTQGTGYFQEDPRDNRHYAYTFPGGWTVRNPETGNPVPSWQHTTDRTLPNVQYDTIVICPRVLAKDSHSLHTYVIIHELAHFCGPGPLGHRDAIMDYSYRKRPDFFTLSAFKALRTADCYSQFAADAMPGVEPPTSW